VIHRAAAEEGGVPAGKGLLEKCHDIPDS